MFLKKFDFLSPQITLYFKGEQSHSSIFSGIVTIISYLFIFVYLIYDIKEYIYKENPTIYFYYRYVKDTGIYPLNSPSIFHFCQLINNDKKKDIKMDYDAFRIIGIDKSIDYYMTHYNLSNIDHWEYGPCDYKETHDDEINSLVYEYDFPQSACIKKYYSNSLKKYLNIGESGFKWPFMAYGASNPNRTSYGLIIEKCHNDSLKNNCKSNEEINKYFNGYEINLNIVDQYADVLNYERPYTRYIYSLTNDLYPGSISYNNLYFNPSLTKTHKGYFFDHITEERSYTYSQEEKIILSPGDTNIIVAFFFLMENVMIYNERTYQKFLDLLSDIGGFGSFILLVALGINYLVTGYITLLDTEELLLNIDKINYDKNNAFKRPPIYKKASEILNPPKFKNYKNKNKKNSQYNSLSPIFIKEKYDENSSNLSEPLKSVLSNNIKNKASKGNNSSINFKSNNYNNNNNNKKNYSSQLLITNNDYIKDIKIIQYNKLEFKSENILNKNKNKKKFSVIKDKDYENINKPIKPIKKNNFTWLNYFCYFISFKKINHKITFYEDFRAQIISEENLLQNYSDIFKLLKICNIERPNPFKKLKESIIY